MNVSIDCTATIDLRYDENSKEINETLEGFCDCITRGASISEMLQHVAFYIMRFGADSFIEGVGYLKLEHHNSWNDVKEPHSGIELLSNTLPDIYTELS